MAVTRAQARARRVVAAMVVATTASLLVGCSRGTEPTPSTSSQIDGSEPAVSHHGPRPTVVTMTDGVEVWDLTGAPSAEAFGIDTSDGKLTRVRPGAYSSSVDGGRPVRFLLPGGKTVDVRANEVIFQLNDSPEGVDDPTTGEVLVPAGRVYSLRVDAPVVEGAEAGMAGYQEALDELGLPADTATKLQQKIDGGPTGSPLDAPEKVGVTAELPRQEGFGFAVSTRFQPDSNKLVFALEYFADWDVVPIP